MNCPIDGTELVLSERQGIEIDYCPKCRGVWLDRGELDKIIERASYYPEPAAGAEGEPVQYGYYDYDENDDQWDDRQFPDGQRPRRRRRSLLGELFDFG
jgi:Zn-finger nucleic acid-binding protein